MATKKYIAVDTSNDTYSDKIVLNNEQNQFTGTFLLPRNNQDPIDIKDVFITGATINDNDVPVENGKLKISITDHGEDNVIETIKVNGSSILPDQNKAVDITIPPSGDTNVIEGITVNGETIRPDSNKVVAITIPEPDIPEPGSKVFSLENTSDSDWSISDIMGQVSSQYQSDTPKAGDLAVVKKGNAYYSYVYVQFGILTLAPLAPIRSISLSGMGSSRVDATVDENGHANIPIDEIQFEDIKVGSLEIDGHNIYELIPILKPLGSITRVEEPNDMDQVRDTLNALVDALHAIAERQSFIEYDPDQQNG